MSVVPASFPATGTDLACAVTRLVTHHRIGLQMAFAGRLDAGLLRRAVRLSLDAEPILGCRFVPEARGKEWQRLGDDMPTPFRLVETDDPGGVGEAFQAAEVPDEGPQAAVVLLRTSDHDEVGIKVSHVVADGYSAKQYAYLLAELYTRSAEDSAFAPEPALRPRPSEADVWRSLTDRQRKAGRKAASFALPNWRVPSSASAGEGLGFRRLSVGTEPFRRMRAYGRERGATVNQLLLAAYFRALLREFPQEGGVALTLMNTADHRRYLEDPESLPVANVSISGSVGIPQVAGESFDDTLGRFEEATAVWAQTCYGAAPAVNVEKLARLGYRTMRMLMTPMLRPPSSGKRKGGSGKTMPFLTNIGVIDEQRLRFAGCAPSSAFMFGPSAKGPSLVATVSTYRETMTIVMGFCASDLPASAIEGVLRSFGEELPA